jgi:hypothetical protein
MNRANGLNGVAADTKQVVLDGKSESEAAEVMGKIREFLPKLSGKSKEKIVQGVTNFLESTLKLTKVGVTVTEFSDQFRIYPAFSLNGSAIEYPGSITLQKQVVAVSA